MSVAHRFALSMLAVKHRYRTPYCKTHPHLCSVLIMTFGGVFFCRLRREEEARKAMEEARRLAEEMARKRAMAEARKKFVQGLRVELMGLRWSSRISAAYVYSYFDLLQWLGLDLPGFDDKKR